MDILEELKAYTEYSYGNDSLVTKIEYEDIKLSNIDLSKFDLNNTYFGGVLFENCDFTNVYLSGSIFGGSHLQKCRLCNNITRKAEWDHMVWEETDITNMDAFRTTFMYGKYTNIVLKKCKFIRCLFVGPFFDSVNFVDCKIEDTSFSKCKFSNTCFEHCDMVNVEIEKNVDVTYQ